MNAGARRVQRVYLILLLLHTLAASFIWGINTLFLLDAGLAAIDLKTLAEAARSLGASWFTVLWKVVVPNIRVALIGASLLSVALVLGEFTIASLLNFDTLQVQVNLLGKRNAGVSIAVSLLFLIFAFVLLFAISYVGQRRRQAVAEDEALPGSN